MRYTLGKNEKLKSKKLIAKLFAEGKRVKTSTIQLIYLPQLHPAQFPIMVGFSVPKKTIPLAVNRNKIKRQMREIYRTNKHLFADAVNEKFIFMFVYASKSAIKYEELYLAFENLRVKLIKKIQENEQN